MPRVRLLSFALFFIALAHCHDLDPFSTEGRFDDQGLDHDVSEAAVDVPTFDQGKTPPSDGSQEDQWPPPDMATPDTLILPDSPVKLDTVPSCKAKYGGVPGFQLCIQTGTSCTFDYASKTPKSCTQLCTAAGGMCLGAQDDKPGAPCVPEITITCGTAKLGTICTCTR